MPSECRAHSVDYIVLFVMIAALGISELSTPYQRYIYDADDQVRSAALIWQAVKHLSSLRKGLRMCDHDFRELTKTAGWQYCQTVIQHPAVHCGDKL